MGLETQEKIVKDKLDQIKKEKVEKQRLLDEAVKKDKESKGALPGSSPDKKTEEQLKKENEEKVVLAKKVEEQARNDERILAAKEEELSKEDKDRKAELVKKQDERLSTEEKLKKFQDSTQKRIDELVSKSKEQADLSSKEKEALQKKIAELEIELKKSKEPAQQVSEAEAEKKEVSERIAKYIEEDKALPRGERREMPRDELEDWLLEDMLSAQEWLSERTFRRNRELSEVREGKVKKKFVSEFIGKQNESEKRTLVKYPELDVSKRLEELKVQGKSSEEIRSIIFSERPKYKAYLETFEADPGKYVNAENGPELLVVEMEKRLNIHRPVEQSSEIEKLRKEKEEAEKRVLEAETELKRIQGLDEGLGVDGEGKPIKKENLTEFQLEQLRLAKKAGLSSERLKAAIKRREGIPGATTVGQEREGDKEKVN